MSESYLRSWLWLCGLIAVIAMFYVMRYKLTFIDLLIYLLTFALNPVHTRNNVEATLSNATKSNVASTKSNVALTLLSKQQATKLPVASTMLLGHCCWCGSSFILRCKSFCILRIGGRSRPWLTQAVWTICWRPFILVILIKLGSPHSRLRRPLLHSELDKQPQIRQDAQHASVSENGTCFIYPVTMHFDLQSCPLKLI